MKSETVRLIQSDEVIELYLHDVPGNPIFAPLNDLVTYQNSIALRSQAGSGIFVFVYDIGRRSTFEAIEKWVQMARGDTISPIKRGFLIGNKKDLRASKLEQISSIEGQNFADTLQLKFIEISGNDPNDAKNVFQQIGTTVIDGYRSQCEDHSKKWNTDSGQEKHIADKYRAGTLGILV